MRSCSLAIALFLSQLSAAGANKVPVSKLVDQMIHRSTLAEPTGRPFYLKATITDRQRQEYGQLVEATVSQIEAGQFPPHSGIRFPQNGCVSCSQLGLCLGDQQLVASKLIRRPGASDLDWLDELDD